jgi:tetratricopeptide (TPR) repeat protein
MILRKVTISKPNILNRNSSILVLGLGIITALGFVLSLQTSSVYASEGDSQDLKINWYDKALSVNQNNVPALVQKGTELLSQGKGEEAITWLDRALSIDPTNLMALTSRGGASRDLGQYQEAIIMYDRVLAIDPHDAYAIGGKADSLFGAGQQKQAIAWIEKILELDPNNGKILQVKETLQQAVN